LPDFTQALASLSYLQPHLDAINAKAEALDVPTPVIDALQELFRRKPPLMSLFISILTIAQASTNPALLTMPFAPPISSKSLVVRLKVDPTHSSTLANTKMLRSSSKSYPNVSRMKLVQWTRRPIEIED